MTNPRIYSRRAFVWRAATGIGSILAANPLSVFAGDIKPKPENIISPKEALDRLIEGNKRYIAGTPLPLEFSKTREALSSGQNPYACILGCADSRVAPELCFDAGIGDLFVTRVAGNFVTPQILASLEYGTEFLGAPLIMVLGHTKCGAIDATIKSIKDDAVFPGHIQNLVTDMSGSINAAVDFTRFARQVSTSKLQ
jgi:carbonic anhydrase